MHRLIHPLLTRGLTCLLALAVSLSTAPAQSGAQPITPAAVGSGFVPGELLVGLWSDGPLPTWQAAKLGLTPLQSLFLSTSERPLLAQRVAVPVGQELALARRLTREAEVAFAEPNWLVRAAESPQPYVPNDPDYDRHQWGMQRIGASRAWLLGIGAPIRVAVLDSGIDFNHPEFQGRLLPGKNYVNPGLSPQDDNGHGTHVAGIIAAAIHNGIGVAGVAPLAQIDPRKVLDANGNGTVANLANGIVEAARDGARIINLSVEIDFGNQPPSATLETAINFAHGTFGALHIAATGNTGAARVLWPAAHENVLAVAATDRFDQRTYYSNYGSQVDLAAPGGLIQILPPVDDTIYSTWPAATFCRGTYQPTSGYCTAFGTSFAAAFVSGAAALIWGSRPSLSRDAVRQILLETVSPVGQQSIFVGRGRLNVQAAMRRALLAELQAEPRQISLAVVPQTAMAQTVAVTLTNPSSSPIAWQASLVGGEGWLHLQTQSGNAAYGQPALLSTVISSTELSPGAYRAEILVEGTRSDQTRVLRPIPVSLLVTPVSRRLFGPLLAANLGPMPVPDQWETPGSNPRQTLLMSDESSISLELPFPFPLRERSYTSARLYSDGLLVFPVDATGAPLPNRCLGGSAWPHQGVYGWWADLNPGAGGSVSVFLSARGNGYVVEFVEVPMAAAPAQRVSFQMVLYQSGTVGLNYRQVPESGQGVTVGVGARDGLLYNQIACRTGTTRLGTLPQAGQSVRIGPSDLH